MKRIASRKLIFNQFVKLFWSVFYYLSLPETEKELLAVLRCVFLMRCPFGRLKITQKVLSCLTGRMRFAHDLLCGCT